MKNIENEQYFLQLVDKYLPRIYGLIKSKKSNISGKIGEYLVRLDNLPKDYEVDKPHCIFDWILMAESGNYQAVSFLNFIDDQCFKLWESIDKKFQKKTENTITEMLLSLDKDPNIAPNPTFQNFLAEIVGLLHIYKQFKGVYELLDIEGPLTNGKTADFVFINTETKEKIYIDMVSINSIQFSKTESEEWLLKFIIGKINDKFNDKTKSLEYYENQVIVNKEQVTFVILPVIWFEHSDFLPFKSIFNILNSYSKKTLQCCSIFPQILPDGSYNYQIAAISNILDEWEQQTNND